MVFAELDRLGYVVLAGTTPDWSARNYLFVPHEQLAGVQERTGWVPLGDHGGPSEDGVVDLAG